MAFSRGYTHSKSNDTTLNSVSSRRPPLYLHVGPHHGLTTSPRQKPLRLCRSCFSSMPSFRLFLLLPLTVPVLLKLLHSDSLLLCHPRLGTQKKRRRTCDAIIFSCNRVNEFQSREDDMICACTTKGNCALPNDCSMTQNKIAVQRHMGQMKCCSALVIGSLLPTTRASHTSEWSPDSDCWSRTCPVRCKHFNTLRNSTSFPDLIKTVQRGVTRRLGFQICSSTS